MLPLHSADESAGRHAAIAIGLVLLLLTAGCLGFGAPSGQTGPVTLHLANSGNATHEMSVSVVSGELGNESVGIDRVGRDVGYVSPKQGLVTYRFSSALPDVESIELPGNRVVSQEKFRLAPNESVQTNITDFQTGDTLVVVDRRDGRISTLITANCDDLGLDFVSDTLVVVDRRDGRISTLITANCDDLGLDFVSIIADPVRTSAAYACN
ncbi:hypothetical protein C442_05886 [Haloarcula amylolytica JCM 13557]|uniref:Uncharacterized protein n=1 Tax=Haloarcula amylolytica JCM 13557 TaxID=1227452 RepID=M0KPZ7_9EURY|nr:hypothetical protein [Haloarcula amylolytica]EMA23271.1 hypothetical protein C442_05886 [Haloarcula amylolytica JCM 13557]